MAIVEFIPRRLNVFVLLMLLFIASRNLPFLYIEPQNRKDKFVYNFFSNNTFAQYLAYGSPTELIRIWYKDCKLEVPEALQKPHKGEPKTTLDYRFLPSHN